ncbi:MAG: glycogen synthase [Steroidobacterales bacterium]
MMLRICFVTAETTPYAKTGGLADVCGALLKYLRAGGHDIRLFMPAYSSIDREQFELEPVEALQRLPLQLGPYRYEFSVLTPRAPLARGVVHLIDCPALYERSALYTAEPDEHRRFLLLTHAAFLCSQRLQFAPQIMHFHDWHAAMGTLLKRTVYARNGLFQDARTVLTIHNLGYQGLVDAAALEELLPPEEAARLDQRALAEGYINMLGTGLTYADLITTVSPTYAREIQSAEYGMGLEAVLRSRSASVVGILNGVDYDDWDPRHDRFLPQHFGPDQLNVKADLKRQLQQRLGLHTAGRTALIGIVSRLATQKGFDLLIEAVPRLMAARDFNLVILGKGEPRYEAFFTRLQQLFPARVHFHAGYSDELAHWIEAASDIFLMPSHYEPCGLNQMYSLRYGTVPVVRRTGGLADSVRHFDAGGSSDGNGVLFNDYDTNAVIWAVGTALDLYRDEAVWPRLVRNAMAQDFSWSRQAPRYVDLYERLLRS